MPLNKKLTALFKDWEHFLELTFWGTLRVHLLLQVVCEADLMQTRELVTQVITK